MQQLRARVLLDVFVMRPQDRAMMQRRTFILKSVFASAFSVIAPSLAFAESSKSFPGTLPSPLEDNSSPASFKGTELTEKLGALQESIQECVKVGKVCEKHCEDRIAAGDAHFEKCKFNVKQMLVMCEATQKLATLKSHFLVQTLNSCISSLETCRDACLEHKEHFAHGMHLECKRCEEACSRCLTACNNLKKALSSAA